MDTNKFEGKIINTKYWPGVVLSSEEMALERGSPDPQSHIAECKVLNQETDHSISSAVPE